MTFLKIGSKSEVFHREGQTLLCTTGLPSDVTIGVGDMSFHLHKFPLLSRSGLLKTLIEEHNREDEPICVLQLHDVPGGAKTFELVTKFCYDVKIDLTATNVVSLRCAAEYLQMNDIYGEGNLISQTEGFLDEVFSNWTDSIKALETCEEVLPYAEELHIVSRCIDSLAMKACADTKLFNWPVTRCNSMDGRTGAMLWNGISPALKPARSMSEDWWFDDVSSLNMNLYRQLIQTVESRGMRPESIAASLVYYANRHIPVMSRQSSLNDTNTNHVNSGTAISTLSEADQRTLLEEIVDLLPNEKGVLPTRFFLRLLRTAMILHVNPSCRENLEKRVGVHLDQASLEDLLIPNMGYSAETLYDVDCVQRILDHFALAYQDTAALYSPTAGEYVPMTNVSDTLTPMTLVANLVDGYLAEVAPDVNLKLPKFQALAAVIPDYARSLNDGLYHAIDVYLKAHPWLTDSEREQICRLMNWQKLSLDASTHAAQNERLPLRVIVQVLFFEQLRLRTSISGWFFVSDNLESSQNPNGNLGPPKTDRLRELCNAKDHEMKDRVSELEKECLGMKQELQKLTKLKRSWSLLPRNFFGRPKPTLSKQTSSVNGQQNKKNG